MTHSFAVILLAVLAILQTAWFVVYVTGPWRATRLGWVWLLKGGAIGTVWWVWLVDETVVNVPDLMWAAVALGMAVATVAWLWATVRARRGRLK